VQTCHSREDSRSGGSSRNCRTSETPQYQGPGVEGTGANAKNSRHCWRRVHHHNHTAAIHDVLEDSRERRQNIQGCLKDVCRFVVTIEISVFSVCVANFAPIDKSGSSTAERRKRKEEDSHRIYCASESGQGFREDLTSRQEGLVEVPVFMCLELSAQFALTAACLLLIFCLAYSSPLNKIATRSSGISVEFTERC
jgi:hypothetical protein